MKLGDVLQTQDWKKEKHVPVIDAPETAKSGEAFNITVSVGKEIAHPNTTEHHIRWIQLFFLPDGGKQAYQLANIEFTAHGESTDGANEGPAYTHHAATVEVQLKKSGTLMAVSLCNIHGLWESSQGIKVS